MLTDSLLYREEWAESTVTLILFVLGREKKRTPTLIGDRLRQLGDSCRIAEESVLHDRDDYAQARLQAT